MIGQTISHYRIHEELGRGGMGVVYKAKDTKLDRFVALKFLPRDLQADERAKRRFLHEAKAASALEHPNICAIHGISETPEGRMFIVMPSYKGMSLQERVKDGPLSVDAALDSISQIAAGLAKAHEKGIIHRDIKPGNVFITEDGHAKILDFGLAKLANRTRVTKTGATVGTISYMSPEQARGEEVDVRSDVFSLGVVMYELLSGRLPFRGDHEAAVIYSIMNKEPEPLDGNRSDLPEGLQHVIKKAMAKDREDRYPSAAELLADLVAVQERRAVVPLHREVRRGFRRRPSFYILSGLLIVAAAYAVVSRLIPSGATTHPVTAEGYSILIVPLEVRGQVDGAEYVGRAFSEALAINLAEAGDLRILPVPERDEIHAKGAIDLAQAGLELGVDRIVTGALTREEEAVMASLSIINTAENRIVWGHEDKSDKGDMAKLASTLAWNVMDALDVELPQLYEYFRYVTGSPSMADSPILPAAVAALKDHKIPVALSLTEQLVAQYPADPNAHLMRVTALTDAHQFGVMRDLTEARQGLEALSRVDPLNPHIELFEANWIMQQQPENATELVTRVLDRRDIKPSLRAYALRTRSLLHQTDEKPDLALDDMEEALRLDPANPWTYYYMANLHKSQGKYDEAIRRARQGWTLSPYDIANWFALGSTLALVGRIDESLAVFERGCELRNDLLAFSHYALGMAEAERKEETLVAVGRARAFEATPGSSAMLAEACARVGEDEMAVEYLKQGLELGYPVENVRQKAVIAPLLERPELTAWK